MYWPNVACQDISCARSGRPTCTRDQRASSCASPAWVSECNSLQRFATLFHSFFAVLSTPSGHSAVGVAGAGGSSGSITLSFFCRGRGEGGPMRRHGRGHDTGPRQPPSGGQLLYTSHLATPSTPGLVDLVRPRRACPGGAKDWQLETPPRATLLPFFPLFGRPAAGAGRKEEKTANSACGLACSGQSRAPLGQAQRGRGDAFRLNRQAGWGLRRV